MLKKICQKFKEGLLEEEGVHMIVPTKTKAVKGVDFKFISSLEGGMQLKGYVPNPAKSKSGVTIATGFDIGQTDKAGLIRLGINETLVKLLKPYTHVIKHDAVELLEAFPLKITKAQGQEIDKLVKKRTVSGLEKYFNKDTKSQDTKFKDLTSKQQTVLASVFFQYGYKPKHKWWNFAITDDWDSFLKELKDFGDDYKTRRNKEADYLKG